MRVLIAGATGAIGRPLVRYLRERHHVVFGLARSPQSARAVAESGAEPVIAVKIVARRIPGVTGCTWCRLDTGVNGHIPRR